MKKFLGKSSRILLKKEERKEPGLLRRGLLQFIALIDTIEALELAVIAVIIAGIVIAVIAVQ